MLPNFLVIGAGRSGTTSLHHYLGAHPEVFLPRVKSPSHFYCRDLPPSDDPATRAVTANYFVRDAADYEALFDGVRDEKAVGEVSPAYLAAAAVPARIAQSIPEARLVAILRNPVERVHARYVARLRDGLESRATLAQVVREERAEPLVRDDATGTYLAAGFCSHVLETYFDHFKRDRIRLYLFDDFRSDPAAVVSDIFAFLGVDPSVAPEIRTSHNASGGVIRNRAVREVWTRSAVVRARARPFLPGWVRRGVSRVVKNDLVPVTIDRDVRAELTEIYRDEIARLGELLERDLSHWTS